jgi:AI-2 transport protein TqsA
LSGTTESPRSAHPLVLLAALVIIAAGLRVAAPVVVPLFVSLFLAMIASPLIGWLSRRKVPHGIAIAMVGGMLLGSLLLLGAVVGNSIAEFSVARSEYQERLRELVVASLAWGTQHGVNVDREQILGAVDPGAVMGLVGVLVSELGGALANAFVIAFTVILILFEATSLPQKLRAMTGDPDRIMGYVSKVRKQVDDYIGVMALLSVLTGISITLCLLAIGVDFAVLWGLIAFLLNFVPNIGSILAALPTILLALLQLGPDAALLTAGAYLVVNTIIGNVIGPRMMGKGLGLSTLTVFVSLILWGWLLGPVGMLVSVPLTGAIKLALESNESTRSIAILLGTVDAMPEGDEAS